MTQQNEMTLKQAFADLRVALDQILSIYDAATDEQRRLPDMGVKAVNRLKSLGVDTALAVDESGQTSQEEHLAWLLAASDSDIQQWAEDCKR